MDRPQPSPLRLHLGCGNDHKFGYVNVDRSELSRADLIADHLEVGRFYGDGQVDEILMIHSIGYLNLWQAREFFALAARLLKPGGGLILELPDLEKCSRALLERQGNREAYLEAVRGIFAFDMDQIAERETFETYRFGWTSWHLTRELTDAGFREVRVCDPETHGPRPWRDMRIVAER